jgi:hypothetical protein
MRFILNKNLSFEFYKITSCRGIGFHLCIFSAFSFIHLYFFLIAIIIVIIGIAVRRPKGCTLYIDSSWSRHGYGLAKTRLVIHGHLVFDNFTIGQGAKTLRLNGRLMDKDIR